MLAFPDISIVIPCYREAEVIQENVLRLFSYLKTRFSRFEIIVVIDGSPDETLARVTSLSMEHPEIPLRIIAFSKNRGKGFAVREGILQTSYDPVMFLDADLTIPIEELEKFLRALETADIAIASRLLPGSRFEEPTPWYRTLLARGFHLLQIALLSNFEFSDTQCGFKVFRREAALSLFRKSRIRRFAFDAEILFLAQKYHFNVAVLPVIIRRDPRNTNVRMIHDPMNMFFSLLSIRISYLLGRYRDV